MEKKIVSRNIAASLLLQFVTIISGFIVPQIIISGFGSEVNGLVSSVNQFLSYITLLEGGVSSVIMASLYKPLRERDEQKISGIINATERFFRQIAYIYVGYVLIVAVIYPLIVQVPYSYEYVLALTCVLGLSLFIQYFFSLTYRLLLNADRKGYIVSIIQTLSTIFNIFLVILSVRIFKDILLLKLISAAAFILQAVLYRMYVKKYFSIDKKVSPDNVALKQRWNGFGQNLAAFIHSNTDIAVLTIFSSLSVVSVYSVYLMIANALKAVLISISSAIIPSVGNIMAKEDEEATNHAFDVYEFGITFLATLLFTCGIVLIVPFVSVYTKSITDADYIQPVFGALLVIAEMIYCFRDPYVSIAYAAGHFKQTAKYAYTEAAINIVISVIMVQKYGMIGIAAGTVTAMAYRMVMQVIYLKKNILKRPMRIFLKKVIIFGGATVVIGFIVKVWVPLTMNNYITWIFYGALVFFICLAVLVAVSLIFFKDELKAIAGKRFGKRR